MLLIIFAILVLILVVYVLAEAIAPKATPVEIEYNGNSNPFRK